MPGTYSIACGSLTSQPCELRLLSCASSLPEAYTLPPSLVMRVAPA